MSYMDQVKPRWHQGLVITGVLLALAIIAFLAMRPAAAQTTGDCEKIVGELQCSYVEHSTGHVYDFHAAATGAEIAWTLVTTEPDSTVAIGSHPDFGDFRIDQETGVLTFKSPPNYEGSDNTYMVMVRVEVDTDAGRTTTNQGVTVNVTNKEEDGSVSLNNLQPQVRELLTASLSDPDGSVVESTWQWSSSSSRSSRGYTDIAGATDKTYRPAEAYTGMYLRATATYTDGFGAELDTAMTESVEPVRAEKTGVDNTVPVFGEDTTPDVLATKTAERAIDENTPAGTNIGPPVFATDDDLDVLTYSLGDGVADTTDDGDTVSDSLFSIDAATGQLMTKEALNAENDGLGDLDTDTDGVQLSVTVTVKDPLGNRADRPARDQITVTITVNDLNEAPTVTGPVLLIRHAEDAALTTLDSDPNTVGVQETRFRATDPDGEQLANIVWELSGPDSGKFSFGDTPENGAASSPLRFEVSPDFEKPGDSNKDNVYQVTVVARDGQLATGMRDVTIRVTNAEETGSVSLSHIQPEVATSLTASLTDEDGGITGLKWQWMSSTEGSAGTPQTSCPPDAPDTVYGKITGKTSATYRPVPADLGKCLRVTATYDDTVRNKNIANTPGDQAAPTVERETSANAVRAAVSPNPQPKFYKDGVEIATEANLIASNETRSYTRYIRENRDAGRGVTLNVADAEADAEVTNADVTATDVVNDNVTPLSTDVEFLQYELGGASKDYFRIVQTDQEAVVIQTKKKLDREDKSRHTVTVKATDPSGGTAMVTVTIEVINEDEAPEIDDAGPMHVMHMENDKAAVASYKAKDPEGKAITWTVLGNDGTDVTFDVEDFKVTAKGGPQTMLAFKSAPNYEDPEGGALDAEDKGNIYEVTLRAAVNDAEDPPTATEMDTVSIMVGVTDVEEAPAFSDASKTLTVAEHTKSDSDVHRNVGSPVTAKDSDSEIYLTYSLSGTDAGYFTIIPATGQIKTMMKLDHETKNSFRVVVTATDPTDRSDTINITIEVDDVAEAPVIVPDGVTVSGETDVDDYNENSETAVGTYEVAGSNAAGARWSLEGDDQRLFRIQGSGASVMLKFSSSPNYEDPKDVGKNNVYEVTVKATATGGTDMDTQQVRVTVMNVDEDGSVAAITGTARVGSTLTAGLVSDPDGDVSNHRWTWERSTDGTTGWRAIVGATASTYEATAADVDDYLRVKVTYTDGESSGKDVTSARTSSKVVAADAGDPLLREYDPNGDGTIESGDMRRAVANFFGASPTLTRAEMRRLVGIYFG